MWGGVLKKKSFSGNFMFGHSVSSGAAGIVVGRGNS